MSRRRLSRPSAHLIRVLCKLRLLPALVAAQALGAPVGPLVPVPRGCTGSVSLGTFKVTVRPSPDAPPLSLKSVSLIPAGALLIWDPLHLPPQVSEKGEVSALLVPQSGSAVVALEPHKASNRAEWNLPQSPGVVAFIVGPNGLSMGKVKSLVAHNQDLLTQLADYAEQTSEGPARGSIDIDIHGALFAGPFAGDGKEPRRPWQFCPLPFSAPPFPETRNRRRSTSPSPLHFPPPACRRHRHQV